MREFVGAESVSIERGLSQCLLVLSEQQEFGIQQALLTAKQGLGVKRRGWVEGYKA